MPTLREARRWSRNESDERAIARGCRFDQARADHVIDFIQTHLCLYEGEYAGQHVQLMPWQIEILSRVFGWVKHSDAFGRWVRRFRKASLWVPKKNGKSPLAAMVGLYLLAADGEHGQKVFSAAKDGKQAQIVHQHARQMVRMSPHLSRTCQINNTTGRILYTPTVSWYDVLHGDNIQGQEGLNGSVIIDETHVVDDRLAKVLEYMGASRSEPMQFEVSTAGANPEGYGRRQYDYGKAVEAGTIHDDSFFFAAYEAPQQAAEHEYDSPEVWKAANPSWGVTVHEEEFRDSAARARRSLSDWTSFLMYRLNVWATSENPWLDMGHWQACGDEYDADSMAGLDCIIGLDLSRTTDMTAAVLMFPGEPTRQLAMFWLPEEEARDKAHLASFQQWARDGWLRLTPGDVISYADVERDILDACRRFRVLEIVYDPYHAEEITQRICEATGCERFAFGQTIKNFAGPTAEYERRVINGELRHNRNPILSWQAGHAIVKTDATGNKRPVKPKPGDHRKIDGIVAGIMGLARVMVRETEASTVYDDRGVLTI